MVAPIGRSEGVLRSAASAAMLCESGRSTPEERIEVFSAKQARDCDGWAADFTRNWSQDATRKIRLEWKP